MDIEPLNTADQVRGYVDISMMVCYMNPAWIQDNGHWVAMDFTKEGGYFFDSFGRPPSYFGFEEFMNENCTTWMYNDVELQSPLSNASGYHVIAFCLSRINNMSHYDYISMFSDNLTLNNGDEMVRISSAFILMCQFNILSVELITEFAMFLCVI